MDQGQNLIYEDSLCRATVRGLRPDIRAEVARMSGLKVNHIWMSYAGMLDTLKNGLKKEENCRKQTGLERIIWSQHLFSVWPTRTLATLSVPWMSRNHLLLHLPDMRGLERRGRDYQLLRLWDREVKRWKKKSLLLIIYNNLTQHIGRPTYDHYIAK